MTSYRCNYRPISGSEARLKRCWRWDAILHHSALWSDDVNAPLDAPHLDIWSFQPNEVIPGLTGG